MSGVLPTYRAAQAVKAMLAEYGILIDELQADTVARGAIMALREPSAAMLEEGSGTFLAGSRSRAEATAAEVWAAMIIAAINEGLDSGG